MSVYYPQAAVTLRVYWEDFGNPSGILNKEMVLKPIIPKNVEVEINSVNEADTFKMELDYKFFPFDPRTIRALGVTIHMEDVESIFDKRGVQKKLIPSDDNKIFLGFADENTIQMDSENRVVRIEGRDYTALLIDQKFFAPPVNLALKLDVIMKQLIDLVKGAEDILIENRTGESLPSPSDIQSDLSKLAGKKNSRKNATVWDVMQSTLRKLALKGYIEGDKFVIDKPRNAYIGTQGYTQFVYGLNLSSLEFKRKIGRFRGVNIRVVGLSFEDKELISVDIPKEATSQDLVTRFGNKNIQVKQLSSDGKPLADKDGEFITFPVSGVKDKAHLIKTAEELFFEYSRQQLEGRLATKEMTIPERVYTEGIATQRINKIQFSKIKNGTPIEVFMSVDDMKEISELSSKNEKKKYLISKFYADDVAEALATSMNRISTPFLVRAVTFRIDKENGFDMDVDFLNIIDVNNGNVEI